MGTRLQALHNNRPKGLIPLDGVRPVPRSLGLLDAAGIANVVLVTGWQADAYVEVLAREFPSVQRVHNPDFARTGSMHSLYLARPRLPADFLFLESDLLYEPRALTALLEAPRRNALLLSGPTEQGDEVHAYGENGRLGALTKQRRPGPPPVGEFVGMGRLTAEFYDRMCRHFEDLGTLLAGNYHYDDALTALAAEHPLHLVVVPDLVWCEIDDPSHHARALQHTLPRLKQLPAPQPRRA